MAVTDEGRAISRSKETERQRERKVKTFALWADFLAPAQPCLHRTPVSGRAVTLCMTPDCSWDEQTEQCLVSGFQVYAKLCRLLELFRLIQLYFYNTSLHHY